MDQMTLAEVQALPAVVDLRTAARILGLGRTLAYQLARRGEFPCRILRLGGAYRVPTAELLRVLGLSPDTAAPTATAADAVSVADDESQDRWTGARTWTEP
jgi:predicted DNA-binding transcriptional regulator AlpA